MNKPLINISWLKGWLENFLYVFAEYSWHIWIHEIIDIQRVHHNSFYAQLGPIAFYINPCSEDLLRIETFMDIKPGDIYEDCAYHPVLCTESNGDDLCGISLIDGSGPRSCSIQHCAPRRLTAAQALKWRWEGPEGSENWKPAEEEAWVTKQWWIDHNKVLFELNKEHRVKLLNMKGIDYTTQTFDIELSNGEVIHGVRINNCSTGCLEIKSIKLSV